MSEKIDMESGEVVAVGCDHAGLALKRAIVAHLSSKGVQVSDFGTDTDTCCDYPLYAQQVAAALVSGQAHKGIVICVSGVGASIAANKVPGIRCALCHNRYTVLMSRSKDNANVLALGGGSTGVEVAKELVDMFLGTAFESGQVNYDRRIAAIAAIEAKYS